MPEDMLPPPEAEVIRLARNATGMSAQNAAEATEAPGGKRVSATYWRDVERGRGGRRGQQVTVRASDRTLAAMARVVGVTPQQLNDAGRGEAAKVLEEIMRREGLTARSHLAAMADRTGESVHDLIGRLLTDPLEKLIWDTITLSEDDRLAHIKALREKRAELAAENGE